MKPLLALALGLAALPAAAQTVYRCTGPDGKVAYQEVPCASAQSQKRVEVGPGPLTADMIEARRGLEREQYFRRNELAGRFAGDARERELQWLREQDARERERWLRAREGQRNLAPEDVPWNPPWGFPGRPGQALNKNPKPAP